MNVQKGQFEEKYLRLPILEDRMNREKFDNLCAKLAKLLILWGELSKGGRRS
jgi:hypothetical protein